MKSGPDRVLLQTIGPVLLVPLQGPVDRALFEELRDRLLDHLARHGPRGIVIDMSGVEVMDRHDFEQLRGVVDCATLMGVPTIFACIRPGIAAGLTMLDIDDRWLTATRTVEKAMARLS